MEVHHPFNPPFIPQRSTCCFAVHVVRHHNCQSKAMIHGTVPILPAAIPHMAPLDHQINSIDRPICLQIQVPGHIHFDAPSSQLVSCSSFLLCDKETFRIQSIDTGQICTTCTLE